MVLASGNQKPQTFRRLLSYLTGQDICQQFFEDDFGDILDVVEEGCSHVLGDVLKDFDGVGLDLERTRVNTHLFRSLHSLNLHMKWLNTFLIFILSLSKFISIHYFEVNIFLGILYQLWNNRWKELLEFVFDSCANLGDAICISHYLGVGIGYVSWYHLLDDHLTNLNGVILANFWLVFHGGDNEANAIDAAGTKLLLSSRLWLDCLKNVHKSWHELAIVWSELLIE